MSTFATMPRLESDSTPATAMASVNARSSPTSNRTSVVTSMEPTMDIANGKDGGNEEPSPYSG